MHLRGFFCCQNYHAATTGDINGARGVIYLASSGPSGRGGLPSSKRPRAGGSRGGVFNAQTVSLDGLAPLKMDLSAA